ncbi:MAG: glycosyltransferase family 39 protein [Anaerolineae bacterium]|nr:glycosyltransferase family 39 protein [Anaerolineae bacterium]
MIRFTDLPTTRPWRSIRFSPWLVITSAVLFTIALWHWCRGTLAFQPGALYALGGIIVLALAVNPDDVLLQPGTGVFCGEPQRFTWRVRNLFCVVGVLLCFLVSYRAIDENNTVWELLLIWGISTWLTIYGLVPHESAVQWWRRLGSHLRSEWRIWLLVGVIFSFGLVLRVAWLGDIPYIQAGDEASFATQAVAMKDDWHWRYSPFRYGIWHHPLLYHTGISLAIEAVGQTTTAARLPSAILGALTVPAVYLMGRRMVDRRIGIVAAIFMAAYPLHVHFSRTGINQVGDPLFTALAFAFLTPAIRRGDYMDGAIAGLMLGLSQYFYSAARIVPLLMVVYVGLHMVVNWRAVAKRFGVLAVTLIVACVVVFPSLYAIYRDKARPVSPRLDQVSIWATDNVQAAARAGQLPEYWDYQIRRSFMAYVQIPDESGFYGGYNPVLGWYAGVPFLVGLVVIWRARREPRYSILALWIAATAILGGVLLVDPPHFPRYISVAPGLAIVVAIGLTVFAVNAGKLLTRFDMIPGRAVQWGVPLVLVLSLAAADQQTYIFRYLPKKTVYGEPTIQLNEIAQILNSFEGQYHVWYFSSLKLDMGGTDLLAYQARNNHGNEYEAELSEWRTVLSARGPHAFLIAPERAQEVLGDLIFELPDGELSEYTNRRTGKPLVYVYTVDVPQ